MEEPVCDATLPLRAARPRHRKMVSAAAALRALIAKLCRRSLAFILLIEFCQRAGNAPCCEKGVELGDHVSHMPFSTAMARLRRALVPMLVAGGPPPGGQPLFVEVFL
jgi:hypothetical protein